MKNPNVQDIAVFRNNIKGNLQTATGYLYECNDELNAVFSKLETPESDEVKIYNVLMVNKPTIAIQSGQTSDQRNIYFRYDTTLNIFHMQPTGKSEAKDGVHLADEFDVYFFPDASFISVLSDYVALEEFLATGKTFGTKIHNAGKSLANYLNNNDNQKFVVTNSHTNTIKK